MNVWNNLFLSEIIIYQLSTALQSLIKIKLFDTVEYLYEWTGFIYLLKIKNKKYKKNNRRFWNKRFSQKIYINAL